MEKTFWISYDLGLRGDYNGMYRWLDTYKAKECGDSFAIFKFDCKKEDFITEISESLKQAIAFKDDDRVYLIWRDEDKKIAKGRFLIGRRKPAPWEGYASGEDGSAEDF